LNSVSILVNELKSIFQTINDNDNNQPIVIQKSLQSKNYYNWLNTTIEYAQFNKSFQKSLKEWFNSFDEKILLLPNLYNNNNNVDVVDESNELIIRENIVDNSNEIQMNYFKINKLNLINMYNSSKIYRCSSVDLLLTSFIITLSLWIHSKIVTLTIK